MTRQDDRNTRFRVAHLNPRQPTEFRITPDAATRAALAQELDLTDLANLHFEGRITAEGADAWKVAGKLSARVVQPCVVTLAPVTTAITEDVERYYSPHIVQPEDDEVEIPEDDVEPLGQYIDVATIMTEALALALPLYPRAEGAELAPAPEEPAEEDNTRRPFAGLADLLKKSD